MHVIELFEESCITDWVGPMEATVEQGDGAYRFIAYQFNQFNQFN